jgi:hypothetical protein
MMIRCNSTSLPASERLSSGVLVGHVSDDLSVSNIGWFVECCDGVDIEVLADRASLIRCQLCAGIAVLGFYAAGTLDNEIESIVADACSRLNCPRKFSIAFFVGKQKCRARLIRAASVSSLNVHIAENLFVDRLCLVQCSLRVNGWSADADDDLKCALNVDSVLMHWNRNDAALLLDIDNDNRPIGHWIGDARRVCVELLGSERKKRVVSSPPSLCGSVVAMALVSADSTSMRAVAEWLIDDAIASCRQRVAMVEQGDRGLPSRCLISPIVVGSVGAPLPASDYRCAGESDGDLLSRAEYIYGRAAVERARVIGFDVLAAVEQKSAADHRSDHYCLHYYCAALLAIVAIACVYLLK